MTTLGRTAPRSNTDLDKLRDDLQRPWPKISFKAIGIILLILAAFYWSLQGTQAAPAELVDGIPNIVNFVKRMFPPQFETQTQTLQTPEISLPFGITIPRIGFAGITFPYPTILSL